MRGERAWTPGLPTAWYSWKSLREVLVGQDGTVSGAEAGQGAVVRPTPRCLLEDLAPELPGSLLAEIREAVNAPPGTRLLPEVGHPLLKRAGEIASDTAAIREPIQVVTDRVCVKVKTGPRRGALWQDEVGQWWLLAAGWRKDDGSGDFYEVIARLAGDSTPIAPTEADVRLSRLASAYAAELELEQAARRRVVATLMEAVAHPGEPAETEVFGALVRVRVDPDADDLDLTVSFEFERFDASERVSVRRSSTPTTTPRRPHTSSLSMSPRSSWSCPLTTTPRRGRRGSNRTA